MAGGFCAEWGILLYAYRPALSMRDKTQNTPVTKIKNMYLSRQRTDFTSSRAQSLTREVRRSPTWHCSKSESALKRFEPVAVAKLLWDGRGTLFALVAARRQERV